MTRPKLNPPARGWQADLPGPGMAPNDEPGLSGYAPNQLNDIYLELPRNFMKIRGVLFFAGCLFALFSLVMMREFFEGVYDFEVILYGSIVSLLCVWIICVSLRLDISPPRDLPLRFNRLRRKIYVYEIDAVWWNPFIRWPIRAVAYDWDDVRAEAWQKQGALNGGHVMKWGVALSVVKPGTNEVIDRFQLGAKGDGEATWAYICTYMQEGPGSLPPPDYPPRDNEDERTLNIAYLLAPKVNWPAEMDIESRTAPADSACRASIVGGA